MVDNSLILRILISVFITFSSILAAPTLAQSGQARANVVVIVDTSISMKEPGMDPTRASLLVTKLFTDIVPGKLSVIRLLDLATDSNLLPSKQTDKKIPCSDDPSRLCTLVERASDWPVEARKNKYGAIIRPSRSDQAFKQRLERHLEQSIANSLFDLAFRAAQGIFDEETDTDIPKVVIWLSDGRTDQEAATRQAIFELQDQGVRVEAIVFGRGDLKLAEDAGLEPRQVDSPSAMMKAFAGSFRRIVNAPYEIDNLIAQSPNFEIKPNVDDAWIVVYGDDTLAEVSLLTPDGNTIVANYAADRWPSAGAYKVAYIANPIRGQWQVRASAGGAGVAYAVVQRSDLNPALIGPQQVLAGVSTVIETGIQAGQTGQLVREPSILQESTMTLQANGQTIALNDQGLNGDKTPGDGIYSGPVTFDQPGMAPIQLTLKNPLVERSLPSQINVAGSFRYLGGPIDVDFGEFKAGNEQCQTITLNADHRGNIPFELQLNPSMPDGYRLYLKTANGEIKVNDNSQPIAPNDPLSVCLDTDRQAASDSLTKADGLILKVQGSAESFHQITLLRSYNVIGLSFWERWGWLIMLILAILLGLFIIYGFIYPERFAKSLALSFVPEREDLDEQSPQPLSQWKGVGIGFYRNASAYLHPDFRISGKAPGAIAKLQAEKGGSRVFPTVLLYHENLEGDYDVVTPQGRKVRAGDVYRINEQGPYFRITVQRGRR